MRSQENSKRKASNQMAKRKAQTFQKNKNGIKSRSMWFWTKTIHIFYKTGTDMFLMTCKIKFNVTLVNKWSRNIQHKMSYITFIYQVNCGDLVFITITFWWKQCYAWNLCYFIVVRMLTSSDKERLVYKRKWKLIYSVHLLLQANTS